MRKNCVNQAELWKTTEDFDRPLSESVRKAVDPWECRQSGGLTSAMGKGESPSRACASAVSFARIRNQNLRVESRLLCRSKGSTRDALKRWHVEPHSRAVAYKANRFVAARTYLYGRCNFFGCSSVAPMVPANYPSARPPRFHDNQRDNSGDLSPYSSGSFHLSVPFRRVSFLFFLLSLRLAKYRRRIIS